MATEPTDVDGIRSILVPTDDSDAAGRALERALDLAELAGTPVHVLAVVDTTTNPMRFDVTDVAELDRATDRLVTDLVDAHDDRDVNIRGAVRRGRPVDVIRSYAAEHGVDLLVVGRTGSGGVADAILGSTADRLVRQSSVPVLVVPNDGADGEQRG